MSREIKFRAWDGTRWHDNAMLMDSEGQLYETRGIECKPVAWQGAFYTGLKDKNGVEIYEGDIVEYFADGLPEKEQKAVLTNGPFGSYPIYLEVLPWLAQFSDHEHHDFHRMVDQIVFQDGAFWCEQGGGLGSIAHVAPNCMVIGNIYENPELMEKQS